MVNNGWIIDNTPYQDVDKQYKTYLDDGYNDSYFKNSSKGDVCVWVTCFVAFLKNDEC